MRVKVKLIDGSKMPVVYFDEVPELEETERGDGGFGSTGVN